MDEQRAAAALNQLERLREHGALTTEDYIARRKAITAMLPGGDSRRARLSARPFWWFASLEVACKGALFGYVAFVSW